MEKLILVKIIIVTHKTLAQGFKDSLNFFTGLDKQIVAICAYENSNQFPEKELAAEISKVKSNEKCLILTDLLGGSVNQNAAKYIKENIFLITGINLIVAIQLALLPANKLTSDSILQVVQDARKQIVFVNDYLKNKKSDFEDE